MRRITTSDMSKLFSSSAVLGKDRFNRCWPPDKLAPVHVEVAVRGAGLELKDPRFCIFLDQCDYLQWVASVKLIWIWKETDRNGDVEVWGIVRSTHYSVCYQTNRLDKEHDNLDERLFTKHLHCSHMERGPKFVKKGTWFWVKRGPKGDLRQQKRGLNGDLKSIYLINWPKRANSLK